MGFDDEVKGLFGNGQYGLMMGAMGFNDVASRFSGRTKILYDGMMIHILRK